MAEPNTEVKAASLEKAVAEVRSEEQAERILTELEIAAGDVKEEDIEAHPKAQVQLPDRPAEVIREVATQVATATPSEEEAIDAAVEKAMGQSAEAKPEELPAATARGRSLLRKKLLERLKPLDAVDASIFLLINNLPHPKFMDRVMYGFTSFMTGGIGWLPFLAAFALRRRRYTLQSAARILPSMWLATLIVEYPVKKYFRRKRPFISIVRAIVVGKKPGNFSFPSGHTAAAFAGATLLGIYFPHAKKWFRLFAGLTGISRIYVGAHYPGDVISGGVIGTALARAIHSLLRRK